MVDVFALAAGAFYVLVGALMVWRRRDVTRLLTRAQIRFGTPGARIDSVSWAVPVVGSGFIALGVLLVVAKLTNGFGTLG